VKGMLLRELFAFSVPAFVGAWVILVVSERSH